MTIFHFDTKEVEPYVKRQSFATLDFHDNELFGYIFKVLVRQILEEGGYEVSPYGYESMLPQLRGQLHGSKATEVATTLRYMPDLVARNPDNKGEVDFVEVKARSASGLCGIRIDEMKHYRRFWPQSTIVLVIPSAPHFYAQKVSRLSSPSLFGLDDFCLFEELFPKLYRLTSDFRRKQVRKVRWLFSARQQCNL